MEPRGGVQPVLCGRYAIGAEIGRGGMALVYRARDRHANRDVAIKVLRPEIASVLGTDRFLREIRIAGALQHPHIVPLLDAGESDGTPFYAMPLIEGQTLRERITDETQLTVDEALRITRQVAEALRFAHDRGIVHRDIKPENILLTGGQALVTDFGVARAMTEAGGERLTSSGIAVGTPAYMSPEQGGGAKLDGRSDVYALGCVLHEMLAGEPPFGGPTPQAVIARHMAEEPRSLRVVRPNLPEWIDVLIARALAKVPADRFQTAGDLIRAIETGGEERARHLSWQRAVPAAVTSIALVAALGYGAYRLGRSPSLDPTRYILAHPLDTAVADDPRFQPLWYYLQSGLGRVPGINLEESAVLEDRLMRKDRSAPPLSNLFEVAREVGAGRVIVPEITQLPESVMVQLVVYDAASQGRAGGGPAAAIVGLPLSLTGVEPLLSTLTERLFGLEGGTIAWSRSTVREASVAYAEGRRLLERTWDLPGAEEKLRMAIRLDPEFADAHLLLAEVLSWAQRPTGDWVPSARQAAQSSARLLMPHGTHLARALVALGESQYPEACNLYRDILQRDSTAFRAWFGLGECHARDSIILRDAASESGWRFRSSYHAAIVAYRRALLLVPSFNLSFREGAYARLSQLLFASPNRVRAGQEADRTPNGFLAFSSLQADTIAFVPYPAAVLASQPAPVDDGGVEHSRRVLLEIVGEWARAFPRAAESQEARALALEALGRIDESAMGSIRSAKALASGRTAKLQIATAEVRLLLKRGDFEEAATLADSLIRDVHDPTPAEAIHLSGLTALRGRPHQTGSLLVLAAGATEQSAGRPVESGRYTVTQTRERLRGYASVGFPRDSIVALTQRLFALVEADAKNSTIDSAWHAIADQLLALSYPILHDNRFVLPGGRDYLLQVVRKVQNGHADSARWDLEAIQSQRAGQRPGELALSAVYREARLWLALGDTTRAITQLDRALSALDALPDNLVRPEQAGSLVRAMRLRAQLFARRHDQAGGEVWDARWRLFWTSDSGEALDGVQGL